MDTLTNRRLASRGVRAFTLVELLVVMAIISTLAGILLPVIGRVRVKAGEVECLNNIRSAMVGVTAYTGVHKGLVPVPRFDAEVSRQKSRPRSVVRCGSFWFIESDYFGPSLTWHTAVGVDLGHEAVQYTCTGFHPERLGDSSSGTLYFPGPFGLCGGIYWPSTYALSNAYHVRPSFWAEGASQEQSDIQVQRLEATAFPSQKVVLFETLLLHRFSVPEGYTDVRGAVIPMAFADGHARLEDLADATPGMRNRFRPQSEEWALLNTKDGVLGIDY